MSNTPMTDLYPGQPHMLDFVAPNDDLYHGGYSYTHGGYPSFCNREVQFFRPLYGTVTARKEADISPVRRPCKLCLAALRRALEANNDQ